MTSIIVFVGEYLGYIMLAGVAVFWWETRKSNPKFLWESIAAAILSRGIITEAIRFFWERPRPFVENNVEPLIKHAASGSFPSGHATFFFVLGTVLYFYNKKAGILFLLGSAILSSARVFAGLHWTSDIVAGALIGIVSSLLIIRASKYFSRSKTK